VGDGRRGAADRSAAPNRTPRRRPLSRRRSQHLRLSSVICYGT
jgi:hypothetical protein